jgi:hypothetical protein
MFEDMSFLERSIWFRYEDLMADPEISLRVIQEFLGFHSPFNPGACLSVSAHSIAKEAVGLRDLNAESVARLSNDEIKQINTIAGGLMHRLGYELL